MAIDLAALKAKLAVKAATPLPNTPAAAGVSISTANNTGVKADETTNQTTSNAGVQPTSSGSNSVSSNGGILSPEVMEANLSSAAVEAAGASLPFDHLEFLAKMEELRTRIHTQHPQMPQLLKTIHTQLSKDPEVVTLLSEEAIGVIVRGLQVQTKTELVVATTKKASTAAGKKVKLDAEMF